MNIKRILSVLLALVLGTALCACQLSEYTGKGKDSNDTEKADTTGEQKESDTAAQPNMSTNIEDYIPEGVDIYYIMDYLNEDLTAYVKLGEYKGLSASVDTTEVDNEYLEEQITKLLEENAAPEKITDRKTAEGDTINVDYVGTLDGVAFSGGSANNVNIDLVENNGYIPGFADGMYDVMPGETVSYDVTFPEQYSPNPNLAGKKTVFTVTVHYIEGDEIVPELDDEFVKTNFASVGCSDVAKFKEYYKGYLEEQRAEKVKKDAFSLVWEQIMENAEVISLPEKSVEAAYWMNRANYEVYAAQYGKSYEEFLVQYVGTTDAEVKALAEDYIKEDIVIYSVVKAEGIELTDEEFSEGIKKYEEQYGMTAEELIEEFSKERIESTLQWNKLVDCVYSWSNVTENIK